MSELGFILADLTPSGEIYFWCQVPWYVSQLDHADVPRMSTRAARRCCTAEAKGCGSLGFVGDLEGSRRESQLRQGGAKQATNSLERKDVNNLRRAALCFSAKARMGS